MKFLAWDTSSKTGAIVAFEAPNNVKEGHIRLVAEFILNVDLTHSESLLWGIHRVLEAARWKLSEIDVFGVGAGPGSFTGLRIGMTTARTLSHTLKKPVVGVSSLEVLARPVALEYGASEHGAKTLVVATRDACKGELFALWGTAKGIAQGQYEEQVIEPSQLMQKLTEVGALKWIAVGEGRSRYEEEWAKGPPAEFEERRKFASYLDQVQARYLGLLVWEGFQRGEATGGLQLLPRYLRLSNAELKANAALKGNLV